VFPLDLLPTVNALLNATSALLLVVGRSYVKRGMVQKHKAFMISAFSVSILFLVSYLVYHLHHGSQPFQGEGVVRFIYFGILLSHTILAAAVVPMVIVTFRRGLRRDDRLHKAIAKWTFPVWTYVSVTGVVIYVMLYHLCAPVT